MAHIVSWPQELIDEFIAHGSDDKQSLLSWSLVSRACNLSAIPHLFRDIRIESSHAENIGHPRLNNLVNGAPRIRPLIRRLELVSTQGDSAVPWIFYQSDLHSLLENVPDLEELEIRPLCLYTRTPDGHNAVKSRRLKHLCLDFGARRPHITQFRAILQILSLFHTVDNLILQNLPHDGGNQALPGPHIQVENAIFERPHLPILQLCRNVLRLDKNSLRSLSFTFTGQGDDYRQACHLFDTYGEYLQHLEIHFVEHMRHGMHVAQAIRSWIC